MARLLSNSWNGTTPRTMPPEVGSFPLCVLRKRDGLFEPRLVRRGVRQIGGLPDMIISLYAGGTTIRDTWAHLAPTIGTELSHDTISKITDAVLEEVEASQTRPLDPVCATVYLHALVAKVRDGHQVRDKAAHIGVGIELDGTKTRPAYLSANLGGRQVLGRSCNPGIQDTLTVWL